LRVKTSNANTITGAKSVLTVANTAPNPPKPAKPTKPQIVAGNKMSQIRAIQEIPIKKLWLVLIFCNIGDIVYMNGATNVTILPRDVIEGRAVVICDNASSTTFPLWLYATM